MKVAVGIVLGLLAVSVLAGDTGFILTEENDLFAEKDNNYTQGIEFKFIHRDGSTNTAFGLRSRMYTPEDISIKEDQPGDRPWAGVTTFFVEFSERTSYGSMMNGFELGVLGPESGCEWQQTEVHRMIGNRLPQGWSNQVPNELSCQYYRRYLWDIWAIGAPGGFGTDLAGTYDFYVGTTFDNTGVGPLVRVGWNLPPDVPQSIAPKLSEGGPFGYVFADGRGSYVLHNATLGNSWLRHDGDTKWDRDLIPWVGEARWGVSVGWSGWSLSYFRAWRTDEFEGQPESYTYGAVVLGFAVPF